MNIARAFVTYSLYRSRLPTFGWVWVALLGLGAVFFVFASCASDEAEVGSADEVSVGASVTRSVESAPLVFPTSEARVSREDIAFAPVFGGKVWDRPIDIAFLPDGESALVADQNGHIYRAFVDGREEPLPYIFISERVSRDSNEEGLLSIALDPEYEMNGRIWLYYSVKGSLRRTRLSWVTHEEYTGDWAREHVVLELIQPYRNHNGGKIVFDGDGMLFLGFGDGGSAADPDSNGQDVSNLYGTVIRLDVSSSGQIGNGGLEIPYSIPVGNPFAGAGDEGALPEIWAYGLRNPWRMSIDGHTDLLWIGDVGQSYREEVNVADTGGAGGVNFGWSQMEAGACFKPRKGCDEEGVTLPVHEYAPRGGNCAITGGHVYRGGDVEALRGHYVYADHCEGSLMAFDTESVGSRAVNLGHIAPPGLTYEEPRIASFGKDLRDELYVLRFDGPILRLVSGG